MPPSDRPAPPPATGELPPRPGGRWRTPLRLAVAAVFVGFLAAALAAQWRQAGPLLGRLSSICPR